MLVVNRTARFRCEKCGRFASRVEDGALIHNEVDGMDVCPRCAREAGSRSISWPMPELA